MRTAIVELRVFIEVSSWTDEITTEDELRKEFNDCKAEILTDYTKALAYGTGRMSAISVEALTPKLGNLKFLNVMSDKLIPNNLKTT